ncbi:hypothetical protein [Alkalibacillus almallahensis]|uniref:hypothetical protein n=1 Tax=Alkalibacillus almallahensis TaxID=1379154 RepID=UPI0014216E4F|nr:hypothetical protein [Alkalibacillus almallahensis]NIK13061.1 hypothetical protein [Alkalibacillus almallahensis]
MSFKQMTYLDATRQQVGLKLAAFRRVFSTLAILQIVGFLFSVTGSEQVGGSTEIMSYMIWEINSNVIIILTLLWALAIPFGMITREQRQMEFMFVTNRFISHLSNIIFLVMMSIVAAFFTVGMTLTMQTIGYFIHDPLIIQSVFTALDLVVLWGIVALLVLIISVASYTLATIMQLHTLLKVIVPAVVIGAFYMVAPIRNMAGWIVLDQSVWLLLVKVLMVALILSAVVLFGVKRLEVRR